MKIIRRFNVNGLWKQDFLDEENIKEVRQACMKDNRELMKVCIKDAAEIIGKGADVNNGNKDACITAIAIALFDKAADQSFTRFQGELDDREILSRVEGFQGKLAIDEIMKNSELIKIAEGAKKEIETQRETERDRKLNDPEYRKSVDEKIAGDHSLDDVPVDKQIDDGL